MQVCTRQALAASKRILPNLTVGDKTKIMILPRQFNIKNPTKFDPQWIKEIEDWEES